ncbi:DUF6059 family protein [Streptomyces sp. NPDC102451]|uniref:DUF6059 family protein n=1 Tax=Streptomyces sp. NPDC102451 TaxID=3366177 RepID=UPI00381189E0
MSGRQHWAELLALMGPGLFSIGCGLWGIPAAWLWQEDGPSRRTGAHEAPARLPPGHPERLAAHVPPTEVERELWSRLRPGT